MEENEEEQLQDNEEATEGPQDTDTSHDYPIPIELPSSAVLRQLKSATNKNSSNKQSKDDKQMIILIERVVQNVKR